MIQELAKLQAANATTHPGAYTAETWLGLIACLTPQQKTELLEILEALNG